MPPEDTEKVTSVLCPPYENTLLIASAIHQLCSCQMGSGQAPSADLPLPGLARLSEEVVLTVKCPC